MARPAADELRRRNISKAVSKMTPERIQKLKEVFAMDGSIREACYYAEISTSTYHNWTKNNPELLDEFERLRYYPVLRARKVVVEALDKDPELAFKYMERKCPNEFGRKTKMEVDLKSTESFATFQHDPAVRLLTQEYEQKLRLILSRELVDSVEGK